MNADELARVRQCCVQATPSECVMLLQLCLEVDELTADDMYMYIRADVSFDRLLSMRYIPVSRTSFYDRCNKVLTKYRDYLQATGRWG